MKKLKFIITTMFIFTMNILMSQILLGYTPEQIEEEYDSTANIDLITEKDGTIFLSASYENVMTFYLFDENNKSIRNTIIPGSPKLFLDYIDSFNENFKKVSDTLWVKETNVGTVTIELVRETNVYFVCKSK